MLKTSARAARGVSLVELLVGLAVGLLVLVGAMAMMVNVQTSSWRLNIEARLNQDLRAAADVMARDLRRSGYWGNAIAGTQASGATAATAQNPYTAVSSGSANINYRFSRDVTENNTLDDGEQFGFRLLDGVLQMQTASGVWTDLTDDKSLTVTNFSITPSVTVLPLGHRCPKTCAAGAANCPTTTVRSAQIALTAQAVRDANVVRRLNLSARMRNDQIQGQCPT